MDIRVLDNPARECAQLLCDAAEAGAHIALTGGSTPRDAYESAAAMGADWSGAKLWWGDERCVAPEDELSNYRLGKGAPICRLAPPPAEIHRMRGELGPHDGADDYEQQLRAIERLDLVLLGLGSDAHVASLF